MVLCLLAGALLSTFLSVRFASEIQKIRAEAAQQRDRAEEAVLQAQRVQLGHKAALAQALEQSRNQQAAVESARAQRNEMRQRALTEEKLRRQAEKLAQEQAERRAAAEDRIRTTEAAHKTALAARDDALAQLDRMAVGQGAALMQIGDQSGALIPFVKALATAHREKRPEEGHRLRLAAVLAQCPRPTALFSFKKGEAADVQLAPDGRRFLVVGSDGVVVVRSASGKRLGKRLVHGAPVTAATFSPDGKRVLSADAGGRVRLWNIEDASEVFDPVSLDGPAQHLAFSGDGRRLVAVVATQAEETAAEVHVLEARNGQAVGAAVASQVAPRAAFLSPDGGRVLVCCTDRCARIYDPKTSKQVGPSLGHDGAVLSASFSADGRRILTSAGDHTARVWDAGTGKPVGAALEHSAVGIQPQFDESGKRVLTATTDGNVTVHDVAAGKAAGPPLRITGVSRQAVLSGDGRLVLLAGDDGIVQIVDLSSGHRLLPGLVHSAPLGRLAVSGDGTRALCLAGRVLRVWDLTVGEPQSPAGPPVEADVVYTSDAALRARIAGDAVQLENPVTSKAVGAAIKHRGPVERVVFSPTGDRLLTVCKPADATVATPTWDVRIWNAKTGEAVSEVMEHLREVVQAGFSPDGLRVLTLSMDRRVRLFDAKTGKRVGQPLEHDDDVVLAVVSPDGKYVATTDQAGMSRAWEAATGKRIGEGMGHAAPVRFVAFSGDGKTLATCCSDGAARAWDVATGKRLLEAEHVGPVAHASFDPAGQRLFTGSEDGVARVWDLATGKPHTPPLLHAAAVERTAFSDDGRWLLTAAGRFVRIHDAEGTVVSPPLALSRQDVALTHLSLSKAGELVTQAGPGTRWVRLLTADKRPVEELLALARVLSGREEAGAGQLAPAAPGELEADWDRLTTRYGSEFEPPPSRLHSWAQRGAAECEAAGLWAGAARHLDALIQTRAEAPLQARRGKARQEMGQYQAALADYTAALAKDDGRADWWAGRGQAEAALGRWDQAADSLTRSAQRDDRTAGVWRRLGDVQARRGRWKESADALVRAARLGAPVWYDCAVAQLSAGDVRGYRRTCDRLVKRLSVRAEAAGERLAASVCGLAPDGLPRFQPLLDVLEKAPPPTTAAEQANRAAVLLRAGKADRAVSLLQSAVRSDPSQPCWWWLLALAHEKAGQGDLARTVREKAAKLPVAETAGWQERQTVVLLRKEAEAALQKK